MRIAVFGATGRTGREIVRAALKDGHEVKALVRDPQKCRPHEKLLIVQGDVREPQMVEQLIEGTDAVISALGTDRTTTLTEAVPAVIEAMQKHDVSRIVTIGTAGILNSRLEPGKLRYESKESNRKLTFAAKEHHTVYRLLNKSSLNWTIVCPTYLPEGEMTGIYRTERNYLPDGGKEISTGDTAVFAYKELLENEYSRSRVGISY